MIQNVLIFKHKLLDYLLDYFNRNIAEGLKKAGLNVIYLDIDCYDAFEIRDFRKEDTVIFTINSNGLFPRTYEKLGVHINLKNYLTFDFFLDHPNYRWFWETNGLERPKKYVAFFNEPDHITYMNKHYKFTDCDVFPLAGKINDYDIPYKEKENAFIFTGNYKDDDITYLNEIPNYEKIFKEIIHNPSLLVEDLFEKYHVSFKEPLLWMGMDEYIRCYYRKNILIKLAKTGLPLYIYGHGWDFMKKYPNVKLGGFISPDQCIEELTKRTICVNSMPWTKKGSHDRVFDASLNGTLVITDPSEYFENVFANRESIVFYDLNHPLDSVQQAVYYYKHPEEAEKIANKGKEITRGVHDWNSRCKLLTELIQKWAAIMIPENSN